MVRYLLHADHCHILPVYMMRGGKFGGGWGLLVYPILLFYLPLSGSSPDMTVILLTGTLSLNSINRLTTKAQVSFQCSKTCVKGPLKKRQNKFLTKKYIQCTLWERSGSVVECLTRDRRAGGSSLTDVTVLWSLSKTHLS